MKLYTRRGDDGQTDLFGGKRVDKDHLRIEAYGTVDELNSVLGLALLHCKHEQIRSIIGTLQNRLFEIGADLATPWSDDSPPVDRVEQRHVTELEDWIDDIDRELPAMKNFILPGGSELAANLHHARCICRRAERACVTLSKVERIGQMVITYLNRLSDLLFAIARYANKLLDVSDVPWVKPN